MVFHSWHSWRVRPQPKHHPLGPEKSQAFIQGLFCFLMIILLLKSAQYRFQVAEDG
jgi:hypothetical protein